MDFKLSNGDGDGAHTHTHARALIPAQKDDDSNPQIMYGAAAHEKNASIIASASKQDKKKETTKTSVTCSSTGSNDDHNVVSSIIRTSINHEFVVPCACWKTDEDVEFDNAVGIAYITDDALLFQCSPEHSVSIDAECIILHAQAEDDKVLYLQLSEPSSTNCASIDTEVMELTLTLVSATDCQQLFEALSQLASLHPVYDDDDEDPNNTTGSDGMMMMMGSDNGAHEENYGDDMVVAAAGAAQHQQQDMAGDEGDDRNAMLDRLDNMLTVPPHLEQDNDVNEGGGQFDDAEDEVDQLL